MAVWEVYTPSSQRPSVIPLASECLNVGRCERLGRRNRIPTYRGLATSRGAMEWSQNDY